MELHLGFDFSTPVYETKKRYRNGPIGEKPGWEEATGSGQRSRWVKLLCGCTAACHDIKARVQAQLHNEAR